ncbi:MAG TPA: Slp family lipoprotein [Thermodesulfovibrionales bacterium]|nr:Slp family lipoprotein [Thermodesulfovibrionales bacterium]
MIGYRLIIVVLLSVSLFACAPVLRKDYLDSGIRDIPLSEVKQNPAQYKGKIFILGGIIVSTKVTEEGSLIEAISLQTDSRGYPAGSSEGRYLALYPKEKGMLDPQIYRKNRKISLAAEFVDTRQGKIDEAKYVYPFFSIKDFHLWEERTYFYQQPYYSPYYYNQYWSDTPYPYWWQGPYWRHSPYLWW